MRHNLALVDVWPCLSICRLAIRAIEALGGKGGWLSASDLVGTRPVQLEASCWMMGMSEKTETRYSDAYFGTLWCVVIRDERMPRYGLDVLVWFEVEKLRRWKNRESGRMAGFSMA